MNNSKQIISILILGVFIGAGIISGIYAILNDRSNVVFVRTQVLVDEFQGMIEVRQKYKDTENKFISELTVLERKFQQKSDSLNGVWSELPEAKKSMYSTKMERLKKEVEWKSNEMEATLDEENQKLTNGAINQINSLMESYAVAKGYKMVLGSTSSGNIMYAENVLDVTEDAISYLNNQYLNGKSK